MDTVSLDQLFQQIGTAAIFVLSAFLVWRRNVAISDRYFTFLEERIKTFEQQRQLTASFAHEGVAAAQRPFSEPSRTPS